MFSDPSGPAMAAIQGLVAAAGALTLGYLISSQFIDQNLESPIVPWASHFPHWWVMDCS